MLKKQIRLFIVLLLFTAIVGFVVFFSLRKNHQENQWVKVVASFYPLGEFTSNLISTNDVVVLVPEGLEPHDYEPTPQDVVTISNANLLIYNGNNLEPWIEDFLLTEEGRNIKTLNISQHLSLSTEDPHFWLDPTIAKKILEVIANELKIIDPSQSEQIDKNLLLYQNKLQLLDQAYTNGLSNCKQNKIIVSHNAFNYLSNRYNFEVITISGLTPEEEPTPKKLAEITRLAKQEDIGYIFFESLVSPTLAQAIAKEVNAKTLVLNPIEGITKTEKIEGKDYITLMYDNLANLRLAMQCQ